MTCVDHTNTTTQFSSLSSHTTMRLYTGSRTPPLLILEKYLWQKCISEKVWMPLCCFGFHAAGHFEALFWMWLLCVLCVWTMILARCACGLWEYKYRAGCIGHDQSIQAGNSEGSPDIIKRKTLELQWSWYGLQNGDGSAQWNVQACAFVKDEIVLDVRW